MTHERKTSYDLKWHLISIKNVSEVLPQKNLLIGCPALARLPNSISVRCESDGLANWYSEQVQKKIIRQHTSDIQAGKGPVNTINAYITQELSSHSSHMRPGTTPGGNHDQQKVWQSLWGYYSGAQQQSGHWLVRPSKGLSHHIITDQSHQSV